MNYKLKKLHVSKKGEQQNNVDEIKSNRLCQRCGEDIPVRYNLLAKFCSVECKNAYHYDKKMGIDKEVETVQPEPYVPIIAQDEPKPRTVYMNNDFERFISTRRAKTIFDL